MNSFLNLKVTLLFSFFIVSSAIFPRPGLPDTSQCSRCECETENWVCNIKCPNQQIGDREVCPLETRTSSGWSLNIEANVQRSNNFCQEGLLINEFSYFGTGNFFVSSENLDINSGLDCYSIRLGDENTRQKITFDLIPSLKNNEGPDFVVYEKGNGTSDGRFDSRIGELELENSLLPEAFATSFKVNGHWTPYIYTSVNEYLTQYKGQLFPDWKNSQITYDVFFDAWATQIYFEDYGITDDQEVEGVSIVNLLPQDLIYGHIGTSGRVLFGENKGSENSLENYSEPIIGGSQRYFGEKDYDPDIAWVGPFRGYYHH